MATKEEMNQRIFAATKSGDVDTLQDYIDKGAEVNCQGYDGQTPLHWAAWYGSTKEADLLLNSGASPSVLDKQFKTPLHLAVERGNTEVVDLLLNSGASPFVVDKQGVTPLHWAVRKGTLKAVDLLLKSVVDKQGKTPLHLAAGSDSTEEADLLLKSGASLSVMDKQGLTPLHWAAGTSKIEVVKLLLTSGASPFVVDKQKRTPYAVASGKTKVLLQKYMDMPSNTDDIVTQFPMMGTSDEIKESLSKGTFISYENCVYLGGVYNVGKSTLASILIGEKITQEWNSPDRLTIYFGRNGIDLKNKVMVPFKQGSDGEKDDVNIKQKSLQNYKIATIQRDIKEEIRGRTYKIEIAPSNLVDFGGQRSFDMTHQLFMRFKGTFVLMFNGTIDFFAPLDGYEEGETTKEILKHWVDSILFYCVDDEDILPIILFCATHSDHYKNEENHKERRKKLIVGLREIFQNHPLQHRIIYDDIFFINGMKEDDLEIKRLKSKLVEVAFKQKSWGKRMPMALVPLDLQLAELRLHNMNIISKEELITLNRRNVDLALTGKQIKYFLNVQHSLGKILYFDQQGLDHFIVVQPQSLVNILRSFITDKLFHPKDEELKSILDTLTETGKIAKQDLLKLWLQKKIHQHMPNDDFKEFIIQVLVHLDILVEPKLYRQESKVQSYLVPCIVKRRLAVNDLYDKSAEKMICLSYTLLISSIPAALSFKLIGAAINVWPLKETEEGICLYHQAAILCIDESNDLRLSVEDGKVFVYLINKENKDLISPNIASAVQECLTLTMTKVLECYHKSFGKSLPTSEASNMFATYVGECCTSEECCYIPVQDVKEKKEWKCKHEKTHQTKYPHYWIFDKKQVECDKCDENCSGLDEEVLTSPAKDKHLFRLAERIDKDQIANLLKTLGFLDFDWKEIESLHHYNITVTKFVALYKWKDLENKNLSDLSFQKLSDAFPNTTHDLCQLYKEKVAVYDIKNRALQKNPENDVLQDLAKQVGNCAIHLGVELGLKWPNIEETLARYPKSMFEQTFDVMKKWKTSVEDKTICMLMKAFQSVDGRGLMFLCKKYGV